MNTRWTTVSIINPDSLCFSAFDSHVVADAIHQFSCVVFNSYVKPENHFRFLKKSFLNKRFQNFDFKSKYLCKFSFKAHSCMPTLKSTLIVLSGN